MHPILDVLDRHALDRAGRLAVVDPSSSLDYRALRDTACGLARRIAGETTRPTVGVLAPASTTGVAALLACWYAGRTPVPLNFLLTPEELARVVTDADLDLVLAADRFAPLVADALLRTISLDGSAPTGHRSEGGVTAPSVEPTDLGALIYTSGTWGAPKGVCLSFDNLVQNVQACVAAAELSRDQVFLGALPLFHAFGFTTTMLVPLLLGATVHYLPRFSPLAVTNLCAQHRVSVFIAIASMFGALVARTDANPSTFADLTHPVSGGEPLPLRVAQLFEQRFGRRILEGYGMTEASPVVTLNTHRAWRSASVGRPLPGIDIAVVGADGAPRPPGHDGQIVIRGHCVMQGYRNKPTETAAALRAGALWTGDIGHLDPDGFLYITGRAREMLIVGGENVFPFEIESVLLDHPGVAEAAVVGLRDDIRGEVPVAYVIPAPDAGPISETELRGFCRERLAAYKVPRRVHVATELPRGPTGKILKRALRPER